jgi:hypothetical protein
MLRQGLADMLAALALLFGRATRRGPRRATAQSAVRQYGSSRYRTSIQVPGLLLRGHMLVAEQMME